MFADDRYLYVHAIMPRFSTNFKQFPLDLLFSCIFTCIKQSINTFKVRPAVMAKRCKIDQLLQVAYKIQ